MPNARNIHNHGILRRLSEKSASIPRMLHMLHMLKAYDVFLQKPSGVLPENVEIIGIFFSSNQRILKL